MYHYTECGLENVWLSNGYRVKETAYGMAVSVEDVDGLHAVLASHLIQKRGRLTGKEFRFLRLFLRMSQDGLAKMLGVQEQSVSLWERTGKVPKSNDMVLRLLAQEKVAGNCGVADMIDRINTVERLLNQQIVASERGRKWTTKARTAKHELEAA